jgi:hypothetical protein
MFQCYRCQPSSHVSSSHHTHGQNGPVAPGHAVPTTSGAHYASFVGSHQAHPILATPQLPYMQSSATNHASSSNQVCQLTNESPSVISLAYYRDIMRPGRVLAHLMFPTIIRIGIYSRCTSWTSFTCPSFLLVFCLCTRVFTRARRRLLLTLLRRRRSYRMPCIIRHQRYSLTLTKASQNGLLRA